MFAASQLWGKVGRAFLLAMPETQYARGYDLAKHGLGRALALALKQWVNLVRMGPPRELKPSCPARADVVLYTDGYYPNVRKKETDPPRIGAVMLHRRYAAPV